MVCSERLESLDDGRASVKESSKTSSQSGQRCAAVLGINSVAELAWRDPEALYRELSGKARRQQDICVLDTFRVAIEQARNPSLPPESASGGTEAAEGIRGQHLDKVNGDTAANAPASCASL
jgi:hypothetical protein